MERQRYGQAEEVQGSSEGEMRDVGRTRPAGKAKERVTEQRVSMKGKEEELEEKEHRSRNLVMDEIQEEKVSEGQEQRQEEKERDQRDEMG